MDKIMIRSKGHGRDTTVIINGEELKTLRGFTIKATADEYVQLTLTLLADVDFIGDIKTDEIFIEVE